MPLIALMISLDETRPIVAILSTFLSIFILIPIRKDIHLKSVAWLIVGTALGVPTGVYILKQISLQPDSFKQLAESIFGLVLGFMIISFSVYQLKKPKLLELKSNFFAIPVGFIAGMLGGLFNTNGPPVVVYGVLKRWDPNQFRASLQGFFFISNFYIVANHYYQGFWTERVLTYAGYSLPSLLLAVLLGYYLSKKIPAEKFSFLIYYFLIFISLIYWGKSIASYL